MNKDLTNVKNEIIDKNKIVEYLEAFNFAGTLTKNEVSQFINIAKEFQLNPFKREIYCIPYNTQNGRKMSILTGYEVYLKRGERLNVLNGWNVTTKGSIKDGDLKAVITIHRKDWEKPFKHEVWFSEYNQGNKIWKEKPITMIKKVVTAQGFRLCFPDEFGGMPYISEELPAEETIEQDESEQIKELRAEIVKVMNSDFSKEEREKVFNFLPGKSVDALTKILEKYKNIKPEKEIKEEKHPKAEDAEIVQGDLIIDYEPDEDLKACEAGLNEAWEKAGEDNGK